MGQLHQTCILIMIIINTRVTVKMSNRKKNIHVLIFTYEAGKILENFLPFSFGVISKAIKNHNERTPFYDRLSVP
jgi:hypothetical protein